MGPHRAQRRAKPPRGSDGHRVIAKRCGIPRVRRRLDAFAGDALDLFGVGENASQLPREQILLLVGQFEPCQARNAFDIARRECVGHRRDAITDSQRRCSWVRGPLFVSSWFADVLAAGDSSDIQH